MTKISKTFVLILAVIVIVLLMISRAAIKNDLNENNDFLKDYTARKEDLQSTNDQLQKIVGDLNATLESEKIKQNELILELEDLSGSSVTVNSDGSVSAPSVPTTPSVPTPVTRAS